MTVRILVGDVRDKFKTMADESVDCVVTSPPYFGLRDYGTAQWEGGEAGCDHLSPRTGSETVAAEMKQRGVDRGYAPGSNFANYGSRWTDGSVYRDKCGKCGARRADKQIGLEPTPDAFVAELVSVFREVRRVLKSSGVCWINLGDSYNAYNGGAGPSSALSRGAQTTERPQLASGYGLKFKGLKPKDLIGIPWRVAFALQADGWWLRQDIIWAKPNPMPESVTDRCTKAHEYMFLLTKSARYYFDGDAIAEPVTKGFAGSEFHTGKTADHQLGRSSTKPRVGDDRKLLRSDIESRHRSSIPGGQSMQADPTGTRNKRSVWEVATAPFSEAHFATFPPALIEPCIKAGCPEKCCAKCGKPWERQQQRVVDGETVIVKASDRHAFRADGSALMGNNGCYSPADLISGTFDAKRGVVEKTTIGFAPSCSCNADTIPGLVLDPFGGAGTTGLVADRLGRNALLIELNPEYAAIAERRITAEQGMFSNVEMVAA